MTILTSTYKRTRIPTTTVSFNTQTSEYKAVIDISGLEPVRASSGEESLQGIVSLSPPTVVAESVRDLIDLSILAVSNSAFSTPDFEFGPSELAVVSYSVSYGIRGALEVIEKEKLA